MFHFRSTSAFAFIISYTLLLRLSTSCWSACTSGFTGALVRSGVDIRLLRRNLFHFIPKDFSRVEEVKALCSTLKLFHSNDNTCCHGSAPICHDLRMLWSLACTHGDWHKLSHPLHVHTAFAWHAYMFTKHTHEDGTQLSQIRTLMNDRL